MSEDDTGPSFRDRLPVLLALVLSGVWIALVVFYVRNLPNGLKDLNPDQAAGLLAATGGPLAAFWLFLAVVEQRRRLAFLTHALGAMMRQHRRTLHIAETQTRTLIEFQAQAQRTRTAETRQLAFQDLAAQVAVLAERLGVIRRENIDLTWARFGSGNITAFVQPFLTFNASHPEMGERLAEAVARDPLAATALHGFLRRYETLVAEASDDRLTQAIIEEGALGRAFRLFKSAADTGERAQPAPSPEAGIEPPPAPEIEVPPQPAPEVQVLSPPAPEVQVQPQPAPEAPAPASTQPQRPKVLQLEPAPLPELKREAAEAKPQLEPPPPPAAEPEDRQAELQLTPRARDHLEAQLLELSQRLDDGLTKAFKPDR